MFLLVLIGGVASVKDILLFTNSVFPVEIKLFKQN